MKKHIILAFAFALVVTMLALTASATISLQFDIAPVEKLDDETVANGVYAITTTLTDTEGKFNALKTDITFDNELLIPTDTWDGTKYGQSDLNDETVAAYPIKLWSYTNRGTTYAVKTATAPVWTLNGKSSTVKIDTMYNDSYTVPLNGTVIITTYFSFAEGKSVADFTSNSFKIDYVEYYNGTGIGHCFNYTGTSTTGYVNDVTVINNVVPEAAKIYISVTEGDKIYLQDGTVDTAKETTDDYEVPATVGYVVVNSGKADLTFNDPTFTSSTATADVQKTYYVDGTSATVVHTDGIVSTNLNQLRGPDGDYDTVDKRGLRFLMVHNMDGRKGDHKITKIGVLMTVKSEKVKDHITDFENITFANVDDKNLVRVGYALNPDLNKDIAFDASDDNNIIISAVMYNIKLSEANVKAEIVCRPFYMIGDDCVYGETMVSDLYTVAQGIKDSDSFASLTEAQQKYVEEILIYGGDFELIKDDVLIDVSGLYN